MSDTQAIIGPKYVHGAPTGRQPRELSSALILHLTTLSSHHPDTMRTDERVNERRYEPGCVSRARDEPITDDINVKT